MHQKLLIRHFKKVYRLFENDTGKAIADLICVYDETIDESKPLEIFDPDFTWKRKTLTNFTAKELLVPIFKSWPSAFHQSPPVDKFALIAKSKLIFNGMKLNVLKTHIITMLTCLKSFGILNRNFFHKEAKICFPSFPVKNKSFFLYAKSKT